MGGEQYNCFVQPLQKLATCVMTDHNENKQGIRASGCTGRGYTDRKFSMTLTKIDLRPSRSSVWKLDGRGVEHPSR